MQKLLEARTRNCSKIELCDLGRPLTSRLVGHDQTSESSSKFTSMAPPHLAAAVSRHHLCAWCSVLVLDCSFTASSAASLLGVPLSRIPSGVQLSACSPDPADEIMRPRIATALPRSFELPRYTVDMPSVPRYAVSCLVATTFCHLCMLCMICILRLTSSCDLYTFSRPSIVHSGHSSHGVYTTVRCASHCLSRLSGIGCASIKD
jgi:hypothetical protein